MFGWRQQGGEVMFPTSSGEERKNKLVIKVRKVYTVEMRCSTEERLGDGAGNLVK